MKVQTLIATINQTDYSLLEKMNIQTDAIVGNQCDRNEISEFIYKNKKISILVIHFQYILCIVNYG